MKELVYWPDPRLKQQSRALHVFDPADYALIEKLVPQMVEVMDAAGGVGLAAIQIGEPVALVVVKDKKWGFAWFANPVIVERDGEPRPVREGCLSAPGVFENVYRYKGVTVRFDRAVFGGPTNDRVHTFQQRFSGLIAHVLQHECEHIDGKFFLDHVSGLRRARAAAQMTRRKVR